MESTATEENVIPEEEPTGAQKRPAFNFEFDIPREEPPYGGLDWMYFWSVPEGPLPTPIDVSITGSIVYHCPELKWYNFDVYPHKIKVSNTGYTVAALRMAESLILVIAGAKWRTERPYLEGGPFYEKHIFSQIHFHWGANMLAGSDHTVDQRIHPAEMQVTFFRAAYMTQEEAIKHEDGVVVVCYIIKYGVSPDPRLARILEGFPRIQEAQTSTKVGPHPLSEIMPMFYEDYFLYWGRIGTVRGDNFVVRWIVPRVSLYASFEQMQEFRKLYNPWDEPNLGNFRPLQNRADRHVFLINPHWCQYNSLLPIPRILEPSISDLSPAYKANPWMLPKENAYMLEVPQEEAPAETEANKTEEAE